MPTQPRKDIQTVSPEGRSIKPIIDGVRIRPALTIPDERGTVCEIYNPAWGFDDAPLVYAYQVTIRPGRIKGWVVHRQQDDRLFFSFGTMKVVLYDDRPESPTHKLLTVHHFGEHNRALVRIPRGVYHAVQNVCHYDAIFINHPTPP